MKRLQRGAWILILIVDVGFIAWGAMAAAWPEHLLGPGGTPILTAGYEGYSKGSWSELTSTAPMAANYIDVLFRMYGVFNAVFGLGPFEVSEYLGLVMILAALAVTAPFRGARP